MVSRQDVPPPSRVAKEEEVRRMEEWGSPRPPRRNDYLYGSRDGDVKGSAAAGCPQSPYLTRAVGGMYSSRERCVSPLALRAAGGGSSSETLVGSKNGGRPPRPPERCTSPLSERCPSPLMMMAGASSTDTLVSSKDGRPPLPPQRCASPALASSSETLISPCDNPPPRRPNQRCISPLARCLSPSDAKEKDTYASPRMKARISSHTLPRASPKVQRSNSQQHAIYASTSAHDRQAGERCGSPQTIYASIGNAAAQRGRRCGSPGTYQRSGCASPQVRRSSSASETLSSTLRLLSRPNELRVSPLQMTLSPTTTRRKQCDESPSTANYNLLYELPFNKEYNLAVSNKEPKPCDLTRTSKPDLKEGENPNRQQYEVIAVTRGKDGLYRTSGDAPAGIYRIPSASAAGRRQSASAADRRPSGGLVMQKPPQGSDGGKTLSSPTRSDQEEEIYASISEKPRSDEDEVNQFMAVGKNMMSCVNINYNNKKFRLHFHSNQ